jgi:putative transposase
VSTYQFMDAEKANHSVAALCRTLGVSRSAFYAWGSRPPSARADSDRRLMTHIRAAHSRSRGTYGRPRIHAELLEQGIEIGERRVGRLMRQVGLAGIPRKRFRVTTQADDSHKPCDNLLNREFTADEPNRVWVTDITYIQVGAQWLYLAAILDLFSRKVVGWSAETHLRTDLCLNALRSALAPRQPEARLIHHSDRGCQYTSDAYQTELAKHGVVASMSRKGNCWDNAVAESFFGTLKTELVYRRALRTLAEARQALSDYIHGFYNAERRHSTNGRVSPNQFEKNARQARCELAG